MPLCPKRFSTPPGRNYAPPPIAEIPASRCSLNVLADGAKFR
jgi:hypothetical protein